MYTRFSTPSQTFLFAPQRRLRYSPQGPGARFLGMLGGAYEFESEESVASVIQEVLLLVGALRDSTSEFYVDAPQFLAQLERLLQFLRICEAPTVHLYSYETPPTLDEIIAAEMSGHGADDWAMEEVQKRGPEIIPKLAAVLDDLARPQHHLSATRLLLFCFPGEASWAMVQRFIESKGETDEKRGAAMLLAAVSQGRRA